MELDPDCAENGSEEEETDLSSLSQDSDEDSDGEEVDSSDLVNEYRQSELLHSQHPSEGPKRKRKRRRWNRDIPFSPSLRTKNAPHQPPGKTSYSYPVPSLRREDAGIFNSHSSPPFTTYSAIPRASPIPNFTLSNLRSNITSSTNSSPSTHRLPLPHRLASRFTSSKTASSPSSGSSSASPSALPSAFRSRSKKEQEGGIGRVKKQVLLKLENNVIVQPSSSYEEPCGIDSSAILFPRSPPLHDDGPLIMTSEHKPEASGSDSEINDSPPASLLAELYPSPARPASPAREPSPDFSPEVPADDRDSPTSRQDVPNTPVLEPNSVSVSAKAVDLKHPRYFSRRTIEREKKEKEDPLLQNGPKNIPHLLQARVNTGQAVSLVTSDKKGSSSSLGSQAPALKQSKSSLSSTEGVFFFDEEIDRYQGSGPDDNDGALLMMRTHQKKEPSGDSKEDGPDTPRKK